MLGYLDTVIAFTVLMLGISLLITMLNQAVSALLAHRGANLAWGLGVLFEHIDPAAFPNIAKNAPALAETVLSHPLVSDSMFSTSPRWASLIAKFPGLLRMVRRWQFASAISPEDLAAILNHIAGALPPNLPAAIQGEIKNLLNTSSPLTQRQGTLANAVAAGVATGGTPLAVPLDNIVGTVQGAAGNLEAWFTKVLDRVSQRFTMWMRVWTVAFAFLIAFGACIDTFQLLSDLSTNNALRTQLVNAAPQINDLAKSVPLQPGVTQDLTTLKQNADQVRAILATSGAGLPTVSPRNWHWKLSGFFTGAFWSQFTTPALWRQFAGVLATALLLSLGAPFWYNALSQLTSLKPVLAGKAPATPAPPSK